MKRTGIARGTTRMRRGKGIRSSNPERKAKRYERDFGALAEHVRTLDCCACGEHQPSDPAHVKSRGAGGHAFLDNGDGNILAFCRTCHDLQGARGWSAVAWSSPEDGDWKGDHTESRAHAEMLAKEIGLAFLASGGERY